MYENLINEWHPTKNGDLKFEDLMPGTAREVWWLCPKTCEYGCKHEWKTRLNSRTSTKPRGCPFCNHYCICYHESIHFKYPELMKEWDFTKNNEIDPKNTSCGASKNVWWICPEKCEYGCVHEYPQRIDQKIGRNQGCPFCTNVKICYHQSLEFNYPDLMKEWNYKKNKNIKPSEISCGSGKEVSWVCCKGHEWPAPVKRRISDESGCPTCKHTVDNKDSLAYNYPELMKEWDYDKNEQLDPNIIPCQSGREVWWKCFRGHEWKVSISNRTRTCCGCNTCSTIPCFEDSVAGKYPELLDEWNYEKNGDLNPKEISYGSTIRVEWKCSNGHEWDCTIGSRTSHDSGCPGCKNKTEMKLFENLQLRFPNFTIIRQKRFDWCLAPDATRSIKLPFDYYIVELNMIIELDGEQHFKQVANWYTPEKTQERDIYKMKAAINKKINFIRITRKSIIKNKNNIEEILYKYINKNTKCLFICNDNEYENHKKLLKKELGNKFKKIFSDN